MMDWRVAVSSTTCARVPGAICRAGPNLEKPIAVLNCRLDNSRQRSNTLKGMEEGLAPTGELLTRVGAAAVLADVLRDLGVEPQAVFDAAGVDIVRFADPDGRVTVVEVARLSRVSLETSGRPDLGLLIARRAGAQVTGLLGRLVASAGDLRSALHAIIRYGHLNQRDAVVTLTVSGGVATLQFAVAGSSERANPVFEDGTVGMIVNVMRALLGGSWRPSAVMLSHAPNPYAAGYRRFFGAPVRFNAIRTALEFPAADLQRSTVVGAADRRAELEAAADIASAELAIGFEERVRWLIRAHLADPGLSLEQIANLAGLSRRSLNRWLAVRGLTFAQLLRSVRFAAAQQLLVESETPLSEIASAIGYAEPSVFSTAFRRWSGVSPREWRRQHGRV
jgi:AraC-like DNA-binding protein